MSTADFNGDGWIDIYVGNDGQPNQLWINQRDGTFRDAAFASGAAVNGSGAPMRAWASTPVTSITMVTKIFRDELAVADERAVRQRRAGSSRIARGRPGSARRASPKTGFGAAWFDADNDGWLDLLTVNGSVSLIEAQARERDPFPFRMTNQLYRNTGDGRFEDVTARAGKVFAIPDVGRGAAFGDVDNDGDQDVVIGNDAGPLRLLVNNVGNRSHWVGLRLVDVNGRDALGARVAVVGGDGSMLWRRARADGSYASANDPRVLVGLGTTTDPLRVRVLWPDGSSEEFADIPINRWTTVTEGSGK